MGNTKHELERARGGGGGEGGYSDYVRGAIECVISSFYPNQFQITTNRIQIFTNHIFAPKVIKTAPRRICCMFSESNENCISRNSL